MRITTDLVHVGERDCYLERLLEGKKILHLGACDAPYTKEKLDRNAWLHSRLSAKAEVLGIDINENAVHLCHQIGFDNVICKDIFDLSHEDVTAYEYVLLADTIEHIISPGEILRRISKLMGEGQKLIVTTPNAFFWRNTLNGMMGFENNHPDHVLQFTPYTLINILKETGFSRVDPKVAHLDRRSRNFAKKSVRLFIEKKYPVLAETLLYIAHR